MDSRCWCDLQIEREREREPCSGTLSGELSRKEDELRRHLDSSGKGGGRGTISQGVRIQEEEKTVTCFRVRGI